HPRRHVADRHHGAPCRSAGDRRTPAAPRPDRRARGIPGRRPPGLCRGWRLPRLPCRPRQAADRVHRSLHDTLHRGVAAHARPWATGSAALMSAPTLAGLTGAALVGLGLYGLLVHPHPLRKLLGFNLLGSGVFLLFGLIARKRAAPGPPADPVPQALAITALAAAFCATALSVPLLLRLFEARGATTLRAEVS